MEERERLELRRCGIRVSRVEVGFADLRREPEDREGREDVEDIVAWRGVFRDSCPLSQERSCMVHGRSEVDLKIWT